MTVEFDPRARGQNLPAASQTGEGAPATTARGQSLDAFDPLAPVQSTVSELDLLFSGSRHLQQLRMENPADSIHIPNLERDILGPRPILGNSPRDLAEIIKRYGGLKKNLMERRRNYAHAMEGFLQPAEALDLRQRIEQIDRFLIRVEQELSRAVRAKQRSVTAQQEEARRRRDQEKTEEDEAIAEWEVWMDENGG